MPSRRGRSRVRPPRRPAHRRPRSGPDRTYSGGRSGTACGVPRERAAAEGRFDVTLFGGYTRIDMGFASSASTKRGGLAPVQGVFDFIGGWRRRSHCRWRNTNKGEVTAARAEHTGARLRAEATQLAAQAEVAAAAARESASTRALAITKSAVTLAARNLDVVRQVYELGLDDRQRRHCGAAAVSRGRTRVHRDDEGGIRGAGSTTAGQGRAMMAAKMVVVDRGTLVAGAVVLVAIGRRWRLAVSASSCHTSRTARPRSDVEGSGSRI